MRAMIAMQVRDADAWLVAGSGSPGSPRTIPRGRNARQGDEHPRYRLL